MVSPILQADKQPAQPPLIVSVESRKGGVGKTTAALCLARLLLKKNYAVLVLDLDITGTNVANFADSPFWQDDLHILKEGPCGIGSKKEPPPVNLLNLFEKCYLNGRVLPRFSTEAPTSESEEKTLHIRTDRINVLGSQIYRTDVDIHGNQVEPKNTVAMCIESPQILFDDLHVTWLLEFIKELINDFVSATHNSCPSIAIILDNSPGYVGIAPAIHDWLTDSGPVHNKFLMVGSLDKQDLIACDLGIAALHARYQTKWETSRLYEKALRSSKPFTMPKDAESFFFRLATASSSVSADKEGLAFYSSDPAKNKQTEGLRFVDHPQHYISLVINRVPKSVKAGRQPFDFPKELTQGRSILRRPIGEIIKGEWLDYSVAYDEYIDYQFLLPLLGPAGSGTDIFFEDLAGALRGAETGLLEMARPHEFEELDAGTEEYRQFFVHFNSAVRLINQVRSGLDASDWGHLNRLVQETWLPPSIATAFRTTFGKMLRERDIPYKSYPFRQIPGDIPDDVEVSSLRELKKSIVRKLGEYSSSPWDDESTSATQMLANSLVALVGLSSVPVRWQKVTDKEVVDLLCAILSIEMQRWKAERNSKGKRRTIQSFLAGDSVSHREINKLIPRRLHDELLQGHSMERREAEFSKFYRICAMAQARIIDLIADSRFLVQLVRFVVERPSDRKFWLPYVRGIAEDVIVRKTVRHEDAPDKIDKALSQAEYFRDFEIVLKRVLSDWSVIDE